MSTYTYIKDITVKGNKFSISYDVDQDNFCAMLDSGEMVHADSIALLRPLIAETTEAAEKGTKKKILDIPVCRINARGDAITWERGTFRGVHANGRLLIRWTAGGKIEQTSTFGVYRDLTPQEIDTYARLSAAREEADRARDAYDHSLRFNPPGAKP